MIARVFLSSQKEIRFLLILSLFVLVLGTNEFRNVSRSSIKWPDNVLSSESVVFCHLCLVEWRKTRQLTAALRIVKAKQSDKSFNQFKVFKSKWFLVRLCQCVNRLCIYLLAAGLVLILLLRQGIEPNPGPVNPVDDSYKGFDLVSQNCRGLTDRNKLIKVLRQIYPSARRSISTTIACLQETHRVDKFAINNFFKGKAVIDDGERNQKGVCILVPESFEVCSFNRSVEEFTIPFFKNVT